MAEKLRITHSNPIEGPAGPENNKGREEEMEEDLKELGGLKTQASINLTLEAKVKLQKLADAQGVTLNDFLRKSIEARVGFSLFDNAKGANRKYATVEDRKVAQKAKERGRRAEVAALKEKYLKLTQ